ncbi:MAG: LysR family transcriptional regulator [Xanthobacteraceae bacterium]
MPKIVQWERQIGRRLRLRDLFVFSTVVKCGSMAKAAGELGVSTPSVSEVIADLEHALGVRLLDRTTRGVVATLYGQALLKHGGAAFDELRQAVNEIELLSDPTAGEVSVGCPESVASILPPVIDAFHRQCPRAVLTIDHEIFLSFAPRLRDRSLDLVLMRIRGRSLSDGSVDDDLRAEIVFNDDLVIAAGKQSRWARRRRIDLAELQTADWILPGPQSWAHWVISDACHRSGLTLPRIGVQSLSGHLQANLLAGGDYVSAVSRSVFDFYRARFGLIALPVALPAPLWPVAVVTLKNRTLSPVAERFIGCVREFGRKFGARSGHGSARTARGKGERSDAVLRKVMRRP